MLPPFSQAHAYQNKPSSKSKPFDINVKATYASQPLGHAGPKRFLAYMDLPSPIEHRAYQAIQKYLCEKSTEQTELLIVKQQNV